MKKKIYTIGYTAFVDVDDFVEALKENGVTCLVDVRSTPKSSYYKDFDSDALSARLKQERIYYRNYAYEFGARQDNRALYPDGYLDFEKFSKTVNFKQGVTKLNAGIELNQTFALMCAEKDPYNCHRSIMVSRFLQDYDFEIQHIKGHDIYESQKDIEERLIDEYYPSRAQFSLLSENNMSDEECLAKAYAKRNREIGFKIEEE